MITSTYTYVTLGVSRKAYDEIAEKLHAAGYDHAFNGDLIDMHGIALEPEAELVIPPFEEFPKIARLTRECVVTEKIDGTNAQILITEDGRILAGSRKRWLKPEKSQDNYGFAAWVEANKEELLQLGPGRHFGEWWGQGIQRGYGLKEKRFSLFNVAKWSDSRPSCCGVVPVLWRGVFDTASIEMALGALAVDGSAAAPGFMDPEGIVIFHTASGQLFKKTIKGDESPKGLQP